MDFEKVCMMFTMQEPFYGILLSSMTRIPDHRMTTMGVTRSGNVFALHYNKDWFESLSINTALELLKHEVLHIAFNHFDIWENKNPTPDVQKIRNIAADMEVNSYIDTSKVDVNIVTPDIYGWDKRLGTREYFSRITKQQQEQQEQDSQDNNSPLPKPSSAGQSDEDDDRNDEEEDDNENEADDESEQENSQQTNNSSSSTGKSSKPQEELDEGLFDDHTIWPEDETPAEQEYTRNLVESLIQLAAEEVEKNHGTIPGEMLQKIEKIRQRPRPVTDWKRYFRRYLGNEFTDLIRKSKKRESKRFPDAAGNRHQRKSYILVAVDTSGSVCMPEYKEFFGQIKTLSETASFHVVECDSTIRHEYEFTGLIPETVHGGGGTDFQPVITLFNNNRRKYDALVYFTDGYSDIPSDTPKETLWVISSDGNHDRQRYRKNGASVVFIPKKQ